MNQSNHNVDINTLKNQLENDKGLSELYQSIEPPEPSAQLDQTILKAARQNAPHRSWLYQHKTLAASAVIFSFVGLLSYQTWQIEQDSLSESGSTPMAVISKQQSIKQSTLKPTLQSKTDETYRAQNTFKRMRNHDTRQLNFASEAPALTSPPAPQVEAMADIHTQAKPVAPLAIVKHKALSGSTAASNTRTAEQLLVEIKILIRQKNFLQAVQRLEKLQKNYPKHPIDPVILQQLTPYQGQDNSLNP